MNAITRAMLAVDVALKISFPDDYHSRCEFASQGLHLLLERNGIPAKIVSGQYCTVTIDVETKNVKTAGFYTQRGAGYSHHWVEVGTKIIDLSPHYLNQLSKSNLAILPAIYLFERSELPRILRYEAETRSSQIRFHNSEVKQSSKDFLRLCVSLFDKPIAKNYFPFWLLSQTDQLEEKSSIGDDWAMCATNLMKQPANMLKDLMPF